MWKLLIFVLLCLTVCQCENRFKLTGLYYSYGVAVKGCQKAGGKIAVIKTAKDQAMVNEAMDPDGTRECYGKFRDFECTAFIGYKRGAKGFKWFGGESSFEYFKKGEPNNAKGKESCVAVDLRDFGKWNDVSCGDGPLEYDGDGLAIFPRRRGVICEFPVNGTCSWRCQ